MILVTLPLLASSSFGSLSILLGKGLVQLIFYSIITGRNQFVYLLSWIVLVVFLLCTWCAASYLRRALEYSPAAWVMSTHLMLSNLLALAGGLVYYQEWLQFDGQPIRAIIFTLGVFSSFAGVFVAVKGAVLDDFQPIKTEKISRRVRAVYDPDGFIYDVQDLSKASPVNWIDVDFDDIQEAPNALMQPDFFCSPKQGRTPDFGSPGRTMFRSPLQGPTNGFKSPQRYLTVPSHGWWNSYQNDEEFDIGPPAIPEDSHSNGNGSAAATNDRSLMNGNGVSSGSPSPEQKRRRMYSMSLLGFGATSIFGDG